MVGCRPACKRGPAGAVQHRAFCSLQPSGWAREFYDAQPARGEGHHAALRALDTRWLEIPGHCLRKGLAYHEATHVANRNPARGRAAAWGG